MAFPTRVWLMESRLGGGGAWDGGEGMVFFPAFLSSLIIDNDKKDERKGSSQETMETTQKMRWPVSPCCPPPPKHCRVPTLRLPLTFLAWP